MEYKEIEDMVVRELMERGLQQQRKEDQRLDSLIKLHVKLHDQLEQCVSSLGETSEQLFSDYYKMITEIDVYQERYLYIQGAKDCVMLLKSLGVL